MKKRLIVFISTITASALIIFCLISLIIVQNNSQAFAQSTLVNYTKIYVSNYNSLPLAKLNDNIRVTVISASGEVLEDTSTNLDEIKENHSGRSEFKNAIDGVPKVVKRYSNTLKTSMYYYAEKVAIDQSFVVIRVAIPTISISNLAFINLPILLLVLILAIVMSIIFCTWFTKKTLLPLNLLKDSLLAINDGSFVKEMPVSNYDEINDMLVAVNDISEKLRNTVNEAQQNARLRADFFANASHELKTPLTSIKGFNELLEISNTDKLLTPHILQIKKESDKMLSLIDDMLRLSALEAHRPPEKVDVDLAKISNEVKASLVPLVQERNLKLEIIGSGHVLAEYGHIYDLVKNISENAVKYNVSGGLVRIFIKEYKTLTTLEIFDTGIGIEEKNLPRIFERFYRVEKSRSRSTGGTGLGLSIVKHIVALYNAKIDVKSVIGSGTTVTVTFDNS